jgi:hypothetical protein
LRLRRSYQRGLRSFRIRSAERFHSAFVAGWIIDSPDVFRKRIRLIQGFESGRSMSSRFREPERAPPLSVLENLTEFRN